MDELVNCRDYRYLTKILLLGILQDGGVGRQIVADKMGHCLYSTISNYLLENDKYAEAQNLFGMSNMKNV